MQTSRSNLAQLLRQLIFINFNLLFFLTPFVFTWMNQELFEFSKMIFVYLGTISLVILWSLRMVVEGKIIFRRSKLDYFLWAFLASQVISTLFSMHPRTSWLGYYTRFNGGLLSTITYITLYHALLSNITKNQIKAILSSLFLSVLLISLYAIPEKLGYSPSCLLITQKFDTNCWTENNNPKDRVFATFGQPNWLAAFLIALLPLVIWQLFSQKNWSGRLYLALVATSGGLALAFTRSRSGFLGLAVGLGFMLFAAFLRQKSKQTQKIILGTLLILAALGSLWLLANSRTLLQTNLGSQDISVGGTPSEEIRKIVWQGALKIWQRYPVFGSGVETFAYSYYLDRPMAHNLVSEWDFLYNKAHNELLNFLANSGAVGLLTYLGIFAGLFYFWHQNNTAYSAALLAGISAIFTSNFFGFSTVVSNLLLFGLAAMLMKDGLSEEMVEKSGKKKNEEEKLLSNFEYFICAIILITGGVFLHKTWQIWQADYVFTNGRNYFSQNKYQESITLIQEAIKIAPNEAFFYDELASNYAQLSTALSSNGQGTASAEFARAAIENNRRALELNPVHLNFYKSQARIYIRLGQLDPQLYSFAEQALKQAIRLAPTDAKLYYNLALVLEIIGEKEAALEQMEYAVVIKDNYLQARGELGRMYFLAGQLEKAAEQYRYSLERIAPEDELLQEKLRIVEASMSAKQKKD